MLNNVSSLNEASDNLLNGYLQLKYFERLVITSDMRSDCAVTHAIMDAARRTGAEATLITIWPLPYQGGLSDAYIPNGCAQALADADVWIDATFPYMAGSELHDKIMHRNKTRYLLFADIDSGAMERIFGQSDLDVFTSAMNLFDDVFRSSVGERCTIKCPKGTNVSFNISKSTICKPRYAQDPGMYVVPGSCSIPPDIETVKGKIVISSVFHTHYEALNQSIEINVDNNITSIEGSGAQALAFERAVRRAGEQGNLGSIIHFTHGLLPRARFTGSSFIEDSRIVGNNAVGFGTPWWLPGGGETHPDGVVFGHSVWIRNQQVIKKGNIVWPEKLANLTSDIEL